MKKYLLFLIALLAAAVLAGCGGDSTDDSKARETMRHLKKTDRVTMKEQDVEEGATYVYTFNTIDIFIEGSDRSIRCEVEGAVPVFTELNAAPEDWNYFKTVQLDDGSICDVGGVLEGDTLTMEYMDLLCPGELEIGDVWESNGTTYVVKEYQYVCDDSSDAFGAFLVESTGALESKVWWAAKEIGFPVKCIYPGRSIRISKFEDDI
ncbi:MAG: hypothetical protein IK083_07310 [Abditibacteriota bacterium]|nr:hypothetical protein [Abditibacteriota bacterium]